MQMGAQQCRCFSQSFIALEKLLDDYGSINMSVLIPVAADTKFGGKSFQLRRVHGPVIFHIEKIVIPLGVGAHAFMT
jgi:hypothetical protein